jgi:hypothetical protein
LFSAEKQLKWETERDFWFSRGGKCTGKHKNNKRKWDDYSHGKWNERITKRRKK